eukprot:g7206.t1
MATSANKVFQQQAGAGGHLHGQQVQVQQAQVQQHQQVQVQGGTTNSHDNYTDVYAEVLEYAKDLFRVISQSGGPFSPIDNINVADINNLAHSVTGMLLHMNWTEIAGEKLPDRTNTIKGKILEALGVFLKMKMKSLDEFIPSVSNEVVNARSRMLVGQFEARLTECLKPALTAAALGRKEATNGEPNSNSGPSCAVEGDRGGHAAGAANGSGANAGAKKEGLDAVKGVLGQFLFQFWLDVQAPAHQQQMVQQQQPSEMHTIGSIVIAQHFQTPQEVLAVMACRLNDLTAQLIRLSMELYHRTGYMSIETSRPKMQSFFQYYTIDTTQAEMSPNLLSSHTTAEDVEFLSSVFSVQLIDSYSALLDLLKKIDRLDERLIAVDFEGVKLCRTGQLCLIQMTLSSHPSIVYVIDVFMLSQNAMYGVQTSKGTTLKSILESEDIEKVWFDPRNDADALWHQFNVFPKKIFDLQLAEVSYVQGLNKVLLSCHALDATQKKFSEHIGLLGKNLFEPACGGDYMVFQKRPLDPQILVYSAHDARYMLELRNHLIENIKDKESWIPRIFTAGQHRVQWCLEPEYYVPNSEAPIF